MLMRAWFASLAALSTAAALVVACGDDDESPAGPPDAGTTSADSGPDLPDSSTTPPDGGDAAVTPLPPIVPLTTTRIMNAINPYGSVYASDGLLYVSGATMDGADQKLAVWRFSNGALDTTFGNDGVVTHEIPGEEVSYGIVEVGAGSFVVHAVANGKVYLVKLTTTGTPAFETEVEVPFSWTDGDLTDWPGADPPAYASWGIALDKSVAATPKIVVFAFGAPKKGALNDAGVQRTDNDRWIARVLADTLAPDPDFNGGSAFTVDADGQNLGDNGRRGIVLPDGTIVSAGYTNFPGQGNTIVLLRLTPAGAPDPAFGFGTTSGIPGQTKLNPFLAVGGFAEAYAVGRQSNGRYVTTGYGTSHFDVPSKNLDMVSSGVLANGPDPTYGKLGATAIQSETDPSAGLGATPFRDRGRDLVVLPDDRIVIAGVYDDFAAIHVLDKDGKPDTSTSPNGVIEYAYPANLFRITLSPDGKKMAATAESVTSQTDAGPVKSSLLVTLGVGPQ